MSSKGHFDYFLYDWKFFDIGKIVGKIALITGITGQDGSYLAELLIEKGYEVHGIKRRSSLFNTNRIDHIYSDPHVPESNLKLHYGDLTDTSSLTKIIGNLTPDEIYNLGAQSHVAVSFETPEYSSNVDGLGTLRLLEAIRLLGFDRKTRFYQASSSELFGNTPQKPQTEETPFYPRSPYAVAKLYSYWITINYREAYNMYACNGILFNHESPRRGETFVTRKITRGLSRIVLGLDECLFLGNINAQRDWGHAKDYVKMQWLMLQQDNPKDYVISTGVQHSVRSFVTWAAEALDFEIEFQGKEENEIGIVSNIIGEKAANLKVGQVILRIDPRYFRLTEVDSLLGNSLKAKKELGWQPTVSAKELCAEMIDFDYKEAQRSKLLKDHGLDLPSSSEV